MKGKNCLLTIIMILAFLINPSTGFCQKSPKELTFPPLKELKLPKIERVVLENGMIVYLVEDHELPLIEISARIRVGSKYEPPDKIGLAKITGRVMRTGGTKSKTGDEIDEELESIAAQISTSIGRSVGRAYMSVLKESFDQALSIFADILMNPIFSEDKIELAKLEEKTTISRRNDNVMAIASREFTKLIYGANSPYARHPEYETIDNITREDIIAFHKKYFHPNNVILGIWGDFKTKEMIKKLEKAFKNWKPEKIDFPPEPKVSLELKPSVNLIKKYDVNQTNIRIGHIGIRRDNPDYFALQVLTEILGGGFSSRLFTKVRSDLGLAYSVWGIFGANYDYPGMFYAGCSTKSQSTCQAIKAIINEINKIVEEEVTDDELKLAKDSILNSFVFNFDTKREIVERLMTYEYYGYPSDFLQRYKRNIEKVTKEDVLRVARKYIHPDKLIILAVGNDKDFDCPLSEFGPINEIDITIPEPKIKKEEIPKATQAAIAKAKKILNASIESIGGIDRLKEVKNITIIQDTKITTPQGEFKISSKDITVYPDKSRSEVKMPFGEIIMVLNGEKGWMKSPQGIQNLPESQLKDMKKSLERDTIYLLQNIRKEGIEIQTLEPEEIKGKKVEVILITDAKGNSIKLAIDSETSLIVRKSYQGKTMMGPAKLEEFYSDYREVSGIKIPFHIIINSNDKKFAEVNILEVKINSQIPESLFERPKQEEKNKIKK
jgi:predicted Zn-dependent peptidase